MTGPEHFTLYLDGRAVFCGTVQQVEAYLRLAAVPPDVEVKVIAFWD